MGGKKGELTALQRRFIDEYLMCLNGTEAAHRAGYRGRRNTLGVTAHDLLRNPKIRTEIEQRLAELSMGADEVLARLTQHARGNFAPFLTSKGHLDLSTPEALANIGLVKKVKVKERHYGKDEPVIEYETEIKLHDSQSALVQLGRHHKLFVDRTRAETWEDDLAELVRSNRATIEDVTAEFGQEIAARIATRVGISFGQDGADAPEGRDATATSAPVAEPVPEQ